MSRFKEPRSGDVEVAHPDANRDLEFAVLPCEKEIAPPDANRDLEFAVLSCEEEVAPPDANREPYLR